MATTYGVLYHGHSHVTVCIWISGRSCTVPGSRLRRSRRGELVCCAAAARRKRGVRAGRAAVCPRRTWGGAGPQRWCDRHLAGEPVAYLIGEWEFYGLPLDVCEAGADPAQRTRRCWPGEAIRLAADAAGRRRVLDLCAGSGCVGLAVAAQCSRLPGCVLGERAPRPAHADLPAEYPAQRPYRTG